MVKRRGRPKKNYDAAKKAFYCGNLVVYEMLNRRKGYNISERITRFLQKEAYDGKDLVLQEEILLERMKIVQKAQEIEVEKVYAKHAIELLTIAKGLKIINEKKNRREK